jgi:hypothetical protein
MTMSPCCKLLKSLRRPDEGKNTRDEIFSMSAAAREGYVTEEISSKVGLSRSYKSR